MIKIGAITIGQSPRVDVVPEIIDLFGSDVEIVEAGGLDGLSGEEIASFIPSENDYVLVSRLRDGSHVKFGKSYVIPRLQKCINKMEADNIKLILMMCTGYFGNVLKSNIPVIYPQQLLYGIVPLLSPNKRIGIITPEEDQIPQVQKIWEQSGLSVFASHGSPYKGLDSVVNGAKMLADKDLDFIVLDCIGYNKEMKRAVAELTNKALILPRTLLARVAAELI